MLLVSNWHYRYTRKSSLRPRYRRMNYSVNCNHLHVRNSRYWRNIHPVAKWIRATPSLSITNLLPPCRRLRLTLSLPKSKRETRGRRREIGLTKSGNTKQRCVCQLSFLFFFLSLLFIGVYRTDHERSKASGAQYPCKRSHTTISDPLFTQPSRH